MEKRCLCKKGMAAEITLPPVEDCFFLLHISIHAVTSDGFILTETGMFCKRIIARRLVRKCKKLIHVKG